MCTIFRILHNTFKGDNGTTQTWYFHTVKKIVFLTVQSGVYTICVATNIQSFRAPKEKSQVPDSSTTAFAVKRRGTI